MKIEEEMLLRGVEQKQQEITIQQKNVPREIEKKPSGKIYFEGGQRVAYTESGKRVIFGSQNEGMIRCELEYLKIYPDLLKEIYPEEIPIKEETKKYENDHLESLVSRLENQESLIKKYLQTTENIYSRFEELKEKVEIHIKERDNYFKERIKTNIKEHISRDYVISVKNSIGIFSSLLSSATIAYLGIKLGFNIQEEAGVCALIGGPLMGFGFSSLFVAHMTNKYKIIR